MPYNQQTVLEGIYKDLAKLQFGSLVLLQASLSEHIHRCFQHGVLQATQPSEQALPGEKMTNDCNV